MLPQRSCRVGEHLADLVDHAGGLQPGLVQWGGRGDQGEQEGDDPADDGVEPPGERLPGPRHERRDDDRLDACLGDQEHSGTEQRSHAHRQHDDDHDLPVPGSEEVHEDVPDEHADRHPDHHLGDSTQPLAERHPQGDHRRHRSEERSVVVQDLAGHPPSGGGAEAALDDEEHPADQAADARLGLVAGAAACAREVEAGHISRSGGGPPRAAPAIARGPPPPTW